METVDAMLSFILKQVDDFIEKNNLERIFFFKDFSQILLCYGDRKDYFYIDYTLGFSYFMGDMPNLHIGYGKRKSLKKSDPVVGLSFLTALKEGELFSKNYNINFDFESDCCTVEKVCMEVPLCYNALKKM